MTHTLEFITNEPGNMVKWTCTCGKTGTAGPGMPAQLQRLAKAGFANHRSKATKTEAIT